MTGATRPPPAALRPPAVPRLPRLPRLAWPLAAAVTVGLAAGLVSSCGEAFHLVTDRVPAELVPLFEDAADTYGVLSAAELAAQARVESKFDPSAVSHAGALGMMQFLPGTWTEFGIDGNIDGVIDPLEPADAIPSAARYNAYLAAALDGMPGDRTALVLAAYNAGLSAVKRAGGIPDFPETRDYVVRVQDWARTFDGQL